MGGKGKGKPSVPCVWNEFPADEGGGYYVADFRGLVETHADTAESTAPSSGGKGKGKAGKGTPPAPPTGKGKKDKGKGKERPWWKEVPQWKETPLPPGYTQGGYYVLPPEATGLSESMYEARVNQKEIEGFIIGWISSHRMWILEIIDEGHTEEWLVEFDHLLIQGSEGKWAQPKAPSALDKHALAPSGDRASYVIRTSKIFRIIHINKEAEERRAVLALHPHLRTLEWAEAEVAAFKEKHPDITPIVAKHMLCRTFSWAQREADAREARIAGLIVHTEPGMEGIVLGSRPKGPDDPPADAKWEIDGSPLRRSYGIGCNIKP